MLAYMEGSDILLVFVSGIELPSLKESLDGAYLSQSCKLHDVLVERQLVFRWSHLVQLHCTFASNLGRSCRSFTVCQS